MAHTPLPRSRVERTEFILDFCRGKDVLHLGCADHPYTEERLDTGSWLHGRLSNVARTCLGVDLNGAAVAWLHDHHGIDNVVQGDAEELDRLEAGPFDVIVAGELIEHLSSPGRFLASARGALRPGGKLVITTTNAFCFRRFIRIPFGVESIHPDHVYYFSHTTLRGLAGRFGFALESAYAYTIPNRRPLLPYLVERLAAVVTPNWGEGLVHVYGLAAQGATDRGVSNPCATDP